MDYQDLLAQNGGFGDKIGEWVVHCCLLTQRTHSYFWGLLPLHHLILAKVDQ